MARYRNDNAGRKPEGLDWFYNYGIQVRAYRFDEILLGLSKPEKPARTAEEAVDRMIFVVSLRIGSEIDDKDTDEFDREPIQGVPAVVREYHLKLKRAELAKQAAFKALSASEQQRKQNEILGQLGGMGGFVGLNVGIGKAPRKSKQKSTITAQPNFKKKFDFDE